AVPLTTKRANRPHTRDWLPIRPTVVHANIDDFVPAHARPAAVRRGEDFLARLERLLDLAQLRHHALDALINVSAAVRRRDMALEVVRPIDVANALAFSHRYR